MIAAVITTRRLRSVTNCFVSSLAAADLLVGLAVMPPALLLQVCITHASIIHRRQCKNRGRTIRLFSVKMRYFVLLLYGVARSHLNYYNLSLIYAPHVWP